MTRTRPTIADIARQADVSVATVDRVLSGRRRVRPRTAEVVAEAAERLGFYASPLLRRNSLRLTPHARFGVLLQKREKPFYRDLAREFERAAASLCNCRARTEFRYVEELSTDAVVEGLRALAPDNDAIAAVMLDHPFVCDEISRLRREGKAVASLLSHVSCSDIQGHVGIDGRKAGRTAAWAIRRCSRPDGDLGVLIGSHRYAAHETREAGFRQYFRELPEPRPVVDTLAFLDDDRGAHAATLELLSRLPNLSGLFVIGGGSEGAVTALQKERRPGDVALVCNEINEFTRSAMIGGWVDMAITTPVDCVARAAADLLAKLAIQPDQTQGVSIEPFLLHIAENL